MGLRQLLLVKPAPTIGINFGWVGAGLGDYGFEAIIVGKTRPLYLKGVSRSPRHGFDRADFQAI
ncbi:hypothetical protein, partial [Microcoleus sp. D3_18a_C4]|uniref:hypothetical protein n=1 Tax=Microcoleus sp. D3_18a_C4 TaxID=3055332 RepID=UPI002FD6C938